MSLRISATEKLILEGLRKHGALHLSIIDPGKFRLAEIKKIAEKAVASGTDLIAVGGTTGIIDLDSKVKVIKKVTNLPVICYPSNVWSYSKYADAVFFMNLLNSRQIYYLSGQSILAAPLVHDFGIDVIPVAYLLFEPGKTAGWISDAHLLPRDNPDAAVACALAGQYLGAHILFIDAGSGSDFPIPCNIIRRIRAKLSIPIIVGGGIRTKQQAAEAIEEGADIVCTGYALENNKNIQDICDAIKRQGEKNKNRI